MPHLDARPLVCLLTVGLVAVTSSRCVEESVVDKRSASASIARSRSHASVSDPNASWWFRSPTEQSVLEVVCVGHRPKRALRPQRRPIVSPSHGEHQTIRLGFSHPALGLDPTERTANIVNLAEEPPPVIIRPRCRWGARYAHRHVFSPFILSRNLSRQGSDQPG